ncbi:hypothetical protein HYPSUDRAFT_36793 [Hypholoma sublateritium FD-334 SS-4]|uniref:Uncharacterized protein n=1 Tax=Hypholoma sublateritium (strain FD-334 SS-4) TaxID=945553 RepID=A0A0D2P4V3_HYPSF|nr:hypothetical protein HYPSUDRAFT_36793 [Hypholoma sublateritium FD-334 SS-4]
MLFRRKETPWEVVESHSVDPVPMYYDDEDLDLIFAKDSNVRRKVVLDVPKGKALREELQKAVVFARERLLEEIKQNGYNVLLLESWNITVLRRAKLHRVEVEYSGRPAIAINPLKERSPPFMEVLSRMAVLNPQ